VATEVWQLLADAVLPLCNVRRRLPWTS